jgi:hypothetical protein
LFFLLLIDNNIFFLLSKNKYKLNLIDPLHEWPPYLTSEILALIVVFCESSCSFPSFIVYCLSFQWRWFVFLYCII